MIRPCVTLLVLLSITCKSALLAQSQSAQITLITGEKLTGQIDYTNRSSLSKEILFRDVNNTDDIKVLSPEMVIEFSLPKKKETYKSVAYKLNTDSGSVVEQRFAQILFEDVVGLYKITLTTSETQYVYKSYRNYAYVLRIDSMDYSLNQSEKITVQNESLSDYQLKVPFREMNTYSTLRKEYQGVLYYAFKDYPAIYKHIPRVKFYDKEIIAIVRKYNDFKSSTLL